MPSNSTAPKRKTKKQQIQEFLASKGTKGATGKELISISSDYGNMICALRKDGYNIQTMTIVGGQISRYILHS